MSLRNSAKRLLWPGLDLHTRDRRRALRPLIREGHTKVLDAGCGNGYLALEAARKGAAVVAVSNDEEQIARNREYFSYLGVTNVRFEHLNLYDVDALDESFDQIFCIEVLEHLTRDADALASFRRMLNPSGQLVLCCPNKDHPEHALGRTNEPENGWHVRDGYNEFTYRTLLAQAGFEARHFFGVGGQATTATDRMLRIIRHRTGEALAIPAFLALAPIGRLSARNPRVPYSVGVVAGAV